MKPSSSFTGRSGWTVNLRRRWNGLFRIFHEHFEPAPGGRCTAGVPAAVSGTAAVPPEIAGLLRVFLWLGAAIAGASSFAATVPASPARPPNILLIISDDQAWTDYGFMGHPIVATPRLDRLAGESLTFPHGYVTASLCCPSLASIVTGRYPHEHRVVCNDPPRPAGMKPADFYASAEYRTGREQLARFLEETPTLPRLLRARGYLSFQSGKWWQGHFSRGGFTHGMTVGDPNTGGRHGDVGLEIGRKTLQPIHDFIAEAERAERPWLVWYAPMMPHDPHTPPERFLNKYLGRAPSPAVAKYWGMVEWFDETCGALLDFVAARGQADHTVVVFLADNGWITDPATGRFAPRSKQSPNEGGLRTPILLRWPGHIAPRRDDTPVSSVDLMPTLLRIAGADVPAGLPGVDLLDARAVRRRDAVVGACFTHDAVDLARPVSGLRWRWVVSGDWKLIAPAPWNEPAGRPELYHLADDPSETRDRAAEEPRRVRRLLRRLDRWWTPEGPASVP